jgi:hypothetical protein
MKRLKRRTILAAAPAALAFGGPILTARPARATAIARRRSVPSEFA